MNGKQDTEKAIENLQTVDGAVPLIAAVVIDSIAHTIPGLNVLLGLLSEPLGAACGVAYLMSFVLRCIRLSI
jgi:hypothetical protein